MTPAGRFAIVHGRVEDVLPRLSGPFDAVLTDPPYALDFMGKEWDRFKSPRAFQAWCEAWGRQLLDLLRPGSAVLAFGGTRTYHRLVCGLEDAGFEIGDSIGWPRNEPLFCQCETSTKHHLRQVPTSDLSPAVDDEAEPREILLAQVSELDLSDKEDAPGGWSAGSAELRLEGRSDVQANPRQPQGRALRQGAVVGAADGAKGRLRHGASTGHGEAVRLPAAAVGGGAPPRPRAAEQPSEQPGAVAVEWIAQGGGAWPACPGCHKPLAPPFSGGPLAWVTGQGFPKGIDVSRAIDGELGAERTEVVGSKLGRPGMARDGSNQAFSREHVYRGGGEQLPTDVLAPATEEARRFAGYNTTLKPAWEPVALAYKPRAGSYARNALAHGVSGLNVDGCRIGTGKRVPGGLSRTAGNSLQGSVDGSLRRETGAEGGHDPNLGRWPANLALSHLAECEPVGRRRVRTGTAVNRNRPGRAKVTGATSILAGTVNPTHDGGHAGADGREEVEAWSCAPGCPVAELDAQSGHLKSGKMAAGTARSARSVCYGWTPGGAVARDTIGDEGGASRFFYTGKATPEERNIGGVRCDHPTVKPVDLCAWLAKLILPPPRADGAPRRLLVPFCGSGSEVLAALRAGWDEVVGVEADARWVEVARRRVRGDAPLLNEEFQAVLAPAEVGAVVSRESDDQPTTDDQR